MLLLSSADQIVRANMLELYATNNPFTLMYRKSDFYEISKEITNFVRPQMAIVSFGIGKCNQL
jgi:hypothetical protein